MQEIPGGGPEMGPDGGPETPADLTRESVATEIRDSEWSNSDQAVQDRYLDDLASGGMLDKVIREHYEEVITSQSRTRTQDKESMEFSDAALKMARAEARDGNPGRTAAYLYYAKSEQRRYGALSTLQAKAQILANAHANNVVHMENKWAGDKENKTKKGLIESSREAQKIYLRATIKK
ncbi:hypothetical protein KJ713_03435 [Patescibacteria group bacterium]|nr:hypothetical protein [Patescibacteria group bacterium]